VSYET
jgi:DNA-directed RNA polymerase